MLTARDIMTREPITVTPETEVTKAANILLENNINGLPVVDAAGKLVGIICQSDLIAQQKRIPIPTFFTLLEGYIPMTSPGQLERELKKIAAVTVSQAMTPNPVTVRPDTDLSTIASLMADRKFHTLPVIDAEENLVGIIGKEDILRTIFPRREAGTPGGD
jgi:CBS domain-containing protein